MKQCRQRVICSCVSVIVFGLWMSRGEGNTAEGCAAPLGKAECPCRWRPSSLGATGTSQGSLFRAELWGKVALSAALGPAEGLAGLECHVLALIVPFRRDNGQRVSIC